MKCVVHDDICMFGALKVGCPKNER